MKNVKIKIVTSTLLITTLLAACSTNVATNNSAPTQVAAVQPTTAAPAPVAPVTPVAPQTPQRTVIENGEVIVWAETFNRDETIKPIKYEATTNSNGTPIHRLYYNVDGHEIKTVVNEKSGDRYFYKDGSDVDFA